jgi:hypothetical protein
MVLWYGRQALIQQVLEAIMVCTHQEAAAPKVRPPMSDGEHEPDQFSFVRHQGAMSWCYRAAEEHHRVLVLEEHGTDP